MSSSSSPASPDRCSQPCFTPLLPAPPSSTHQDIKESISDKIADNKTATVGCREVPESAYGSDSEEAREKHQQRRRPGSLWAHGIAAVSPRFAASAEDKASESSLPLLPLHTKHSEHRPRWLRTPNRSRCLLYIVVAFLTMLGIFQFLSLACGILISFFPDEIDRVADHWRQPQSADPSDITRWPTDISRDVFPVSCHSHNDYWRRVPLYSALEAGCTGVEADVWLFDDDLFVGHTRSALTPSRTLRNMYIDPLLSILRRQNPITNFHPDIDQPRNGVFDTDPSQTLVLLIDFKTDGGETWDYVYAQLTPLRESGYLTYYNGSDVIKGPITVVGTGNAPFNKIAGSTTYRDIFFDAPLDQLVENIDRIETKERLEERAGNARGGLLGDSNGDIEPDIFNTTNSYYASVSFKKAVGIPWMLHLTDRQVQTIRSQIRAAHRQGLKVRYWGTPTWPRSLRNHVWRVLAREGVDMLNVDDLLSATRKEWAPSILDWWQ
ncbi:uncharacterized protein BDW70DRAFT_59039 [Aspergillus foveolatus]|uniref:uncharacterized protein n=1 Tax=Aspergillus foveolatus TaxID=210207 RepID=UPI003CCDCEDB